MTVPMLDGVVVTAGGGTTVVELAGGGTGAVDLDGTGVLAGGAGGAVVVIGQMVVEMMIEEVTTIGLVVYGHEVTVGAQELMVTTLLV